jgi:hypothetical protein
VFGAAGEAVEEAVLNSLARSRRGAGAARSEDGRGGLDRSTPRGEGEGLVGEAFGCYLSDVSFI